jgi:hypothetical protein
MPGHQAGCMGLSRRQIRDAFEKAVDKGLIEYTHSFGTKRFHKLTKLGLEYVNDND